MAVTEKIREHASPKPHGLAHDLNNDLSVIVGRCDLLTEMLLPDGEVAKQLRLIREAAHRMARRIARQQQH